MHPESNPAAGYDGGLPLAPRPIVIIGTGGIVRDAHLPAYTKAGFPVWGLVNRTRSRAQELADQYGIESVFDNVRDAVAAAPPDAVFDIAQMPEQYLSTIEQLPDGAAVLIQKPLGQNLGEGRRLRDLCASKNLVAAVNTQLRFAPYIHAARALIADGVIGELYDFELRVSVNTPWHLFPHVLGMPRLELNMHSVHYMDLARSFFGDPSGVSALTVRHPEKTEVANTRSAILLHYKDRPLRVTISTNHDHGFGSRYEESFVKWEGTKGAIRAQMGLLLDYPTGGQDSLQMALSEAPDAGWRDIPFSGSWFPDAFIGSMGVLQRFVEGSIDRLPTSVDDVLSTMAVVDAAYTSAEHGGTRIEPPLAHPEPRKGPVDGSH